jgi:hypothetical protein
MSRQDKDERRQDNTKTRQDQDQDQTIQSQYKDERKTRQKLD